jgi:hypothetical protein
MIYHRPDFSILTPPKRALLLISQIWVNPNTEDIKGKVY